MVAGVVVDGGSPTPAQVRTGRPGPVALVLVSTPARSTGGRSHGPRNAGGEPIIGAVVARTLISAGRILAGQVTAVALEASADPAAFDQAALRFPAADIYELWAPARPAAISAA